MIILDIRPIRIVECPGFRDMVSVLEPGYVMPSRRTVKSMIFHLYEESKSKIINLLVTTSTFVSLTTDIWTSLANDAYISLSAHWITPTWEVKCCILETRVSWTSHRCVYIENITKMVSKFGIENKVSAIIYDQASNM